MRGIFGAGFGALALLAAIGAAIGQDGPRAATADEEKAIRDLIEKSDEPKKLTDFKELTKDAEKIDGLFTLHRKDEHLYAEIKPNQLDQPLLAPIAIARGMAIGRQPAELRRRVGPQLPPGRRHRCSSSARTSTTRHPTARRSRRRSSRTTPTRSCWPCRSSASTTQNGSAVVIDLADIFLTDFAELGLGVLDRNRTSWHKIKAFPNNLELRGRGDLSGFGGGYYGYVRRHGVADARGITLVIHYSLVKLPEHGYEPRLADDRVGHFISAIKDFGQRGPRRQLRPPDQPLAAGEVRPRRRSSRRRRSRSSGGSRTTSRSSTGRPSRRASSSGTRRSRRSASATPWPSAGRPGRGATTSTPRTSTTAPSAGSPPARPTPCRACGPTR